MFRAVNQSLKLMSSKQRWQFFGLVSVRAVSGVLDVIGIALIGLLAGLAASNLDPSKPLNILGFTLPSVSQQTLIYIVFGVLFIFAFKALVAVSLGKMISLFLAKVESEKAVEIARYLFSGNLSNLQKINKGEIVWALMGSVAFAFSGLLSSLSTFIAEGVLLLLIGSTFFIVDPAATLFVIVYFGIIILTIQLIIGRSLKKAGSDAASGNTESMVVIDDFIGTFREIAILNKQSFFLNKFQVARYKLSSGFGSMAFLGGMPRYVVETALMLGVVVFVGFQFATGQLASGLVTVGVFLTGGVRIMASLLPLQNAVAQVKNQVEQSKLARELLENADQAKLANSSAASELTAGEVTAKDFRVNLENVSFQYPGAKDYALKGVTLSIEPGQHVAFIGPSGAGKTTLVDLILGLIVPTSGTISLGGLKLGHPEFSTTQLISYVPQNPGVVTGSILENVALGIPESEVDEEKVLDSLTKANLFDFVDQLELGIHTIIGSHSDSLSGGQVQRLGLARALYSSPKLVVLDEATSALDASSEAQISSSLRELGEDVTVIVIAHRLSTVQHSDKVFVVEDGSISASGTFMHLRKTVPMVAEYVKLMSFEQNQD